MPSAIRPYTCCSLQESILIFRANKQFEPFGDKALELIQKQCAHISHEDKSYFQKPLLFSESGKMRVQAIFSNVLLTQNLQWKWHQIYTRMNNLSITCSPVYVHPSRMYTKQPCSSIASSVFRAQNSRCKTLNRICVK